MEDIIESIVRNIDYKKDDTVIIDDKRFEIDKKKFSDINEGKNERFAFIDGGNLEIIRSPSISLFFNRVYYTIYSGNKRTENKIFEFYTLITANNKQGEIYYDTQYFFTKNKISLKRYSFNSFDNSLKTGNKRADISVVGNIIRRFAELSVAASIHDCIVCLDGSLEKSYTHEEALLKKLSKKKLCGLSKTNDILTDKGSSFGSFLNHIAKKDEWIYEAAILDDYTVYFGKFNPASDYIFRIDIKNADPDNVFFTVKQNCRDAVFPGYPYGLIEADRFARVSKKEQNTLKLRLEFMMKRKYKELLPLLNLKNAHSILDNLG